MENTTQDWAGRTVHGRDGATLGRLTEVHRHGPGEWGVVRSRLGRRRLVPLDDAAVHDRGVRVPLDRASLRTAPRVAATTPDAATATALHDHYHGRRVLADAHERQHDRYGGAKLGAAFFGWLVAVGLTVLLAGLVGSVVAAIGPAGAPPSALAAALVAVAVLVIAYYAGGYVTGRLARFDGARNGLFTWVIGLLAGIVAAVVAATGNVRFNVLTDQLPALPLTAAQLTVGGIVTAATIVAGTLLAAMLGGKAGERFHRRVDRVGT